MASPKRQRRVLWSLGVVCFTTGLFSFFSVWFSTFSWSETIRRSADSAWTRRGLSESDQCASMTSWEAQYGLIVYPMALLYAFIALAIVCDDYFVSSLEKITEALGLSEDVAGATFMAAGSSAPELFVSMADNVLSKPKESLGIGTIVGSAIFNILIIIALTALLAGQTLVLDWRPLLRDSLWYTWSIVVLTVTIWDGQVDLYESILLFGSYVGYILYMAINHRVIDACCQRPTQEQLHDDQQDKDNDKDDDDDDDKTALKTHKLDASQARAIATEAVTLAGLTAVTASASASASAKLDSTATTRTNITMTTTRAWTIDVETVQRDRTNVAASNFPRKLSDPLDHAGRLSTTSDSNDHLDHHQHQQHLHHEHRLNRLNPMYRSKYRSFHSHMNSASRESLDRDQPPPPPPPELPHVASPNESQEDDNNDHENQPPNYCDELTNLPSTCLGKLWFIFTYPLVVAMRLTIPDCRFAMFSGTFGFSACFVLSIVWIAWLSHLLVVWSTKIGCLLGIPPALMGLTIVAAGTSVPDALSSVLVARDGQGDMAVSNAIGSNVFDILLGLGLPFFLSNLVYKVPVQVSTSDLTLSIFILFGVLTTVILLLMVSCWRLHRITGVLMLLLYVAYVIVTYLRGLGKL